MLFDHTGHRPQMPQPSTQAGDSCLVGLLQERVQRLAQGIHNETNLTQGIVVQNVAAIEDEGRLGHVIVDGLVVILLELIPLSQHTDGMSILGSLHVAGTGL